MATAPTVDKRYSLAGIALPVILAIVGSLGTWLVVGTEVRTTVTAHEERIAKLEKAHDLDIVEIATLRARADQTAKSFEEVGHKLDTVSDDIKKLLAMRSR